MKQNWHSKILGNILKVQNGYAFDSKLFSTENGIPLIRIRDLKVGLGTETRYSGDYDEKYLVQAGDLLVGMDGEFGCYEWRGGEALLNQRVCRLQEFTSELQPKYLLYGLNCHLKAIEEVTGFTTVRHLSSKQITSIRFFLPPLKEQKHIIAMLDKLFEQINTLIENTKKSIANNHELLKTYIYAAVSDPQQEWTEKSLKEVSKAFGRGKSKHRPRGDKKLLGGPYPLIQTGDVANSNHIIVEYSQSYSECGLAQSKLWPKGTVCIAIVGANVAETAILGFDACFPDSVIGIVVNDELADNEYVEYLLQTFKTLLKERGKGTARDNINLGTFENQTFPFPDIGKQKQIVVNINDLAHKTQRLEAIYQQRLDNLTELKQSILQRALSGKMTAGFVDAVAEAAE